MLKMDDQGSFVTATEGGPPEPAAWRTAGYLLLSAAVLGFLFQAWWIIKGDPHPGWHSDSLFYLILADFYSGHVSAGDAPILAKNFYETSRFPPLFPLALALGGAGTQSWTAAYYVVLSFGLLSVITSFLWLRQETGHTLSAGSLLPMAVLSPQYLYLHLEILSESQFVFLFTFLLGLVSLCEQRKCSVWTVAAVACLLPLSRTAGLTVLVAVSIWLMFKKRELPIRHRLLAGLVMWVPPAAWMLYRRTYPVLLDYSDDLTNPISAGILSWLIDVVCQAPRLVGGYASWFDPDGGRLAYGVTVLILSLTAIGWFQRVRKLRVDAVFLPIYLLLIAAWPYPLETTRLLSITMPVVTLSAWSGLRTLFSLVKTEKPSRRLLVTPAITLLCLSLFASSAKWLDIVDRATAKYDPEFGSSIRTFTYLAAPRDHMEIAPEMITRFVEMSKTLPEVVDEGECVWTPLFAVTAYFSAFEVRLIPTPEDIDSIDEARDRLEACRYILVTNLFGADMTYEQMYPTAFLGWAKPRLLSKLDDERGGYVAAALLDLRE